MQTEIALPFHTMIDHLTQEVVRADMEMRLLQQRGWEELIRGFPLAEGMDRLEQLGLTEISFSFALEPVPLPRWRKIFNWLLRILGRQAPLEIRLFRLGSRNNPEVQQVNVNVIIKRDVSRSAEAKYEPASMGNSYVTGYPV